MKNGGKFASCSPLNPMWDAPGIGATLATYPENGMLVSYLDMPIIFTIP